MPRGLNREGNFNSGIPVNIPVEFNTPVNLPLNVGNQVTLPIPGNTVNWVPSPSHFGNLIGAGANTSGLLLENGIAFFELEDGSGIIILET